MNIDIDFWDEFNSAVTICDKNGIIVYMNEKSALTFEKWGGKNLIGKSLFDCHNSISRQKIREMLESGSSNSYTIEKNGIKKLIHQAPWKENGIIKGLIEISIEVPFEMIHHNRN